MSAEPDDELQRLLESVLAGERSTSDPQVQAAMRENDRFAREVVGLQQLQAKLSERAVEVKQDLEHRAPELEAAVENLVLARGRQRLPGRSPRWPWLLAAAVLAVVLAAWPRREGPKTPEYLGGELSVVPTADGRGLQFRLLKATQSYFVVTVLDREGHRKFPPIEVEASTWVPDAKLVDAWPPGGRVAVEARQADGQPIAAARPLEWSPTR
jgi:hypothetical protein